MAGFNVSQIRDVTQPEARKELASIVDDIDALAIDIARSLKPQHPSDQSIPLVIKWLPKFFLRAAVEHLRVGRILIQATMPRATLGLARPVLELLIEFAYINEEFSNDRAAEYVAAQLVAPQLLSLRMIPGTPEHERHGHAWTEITGGLDGNELAGVRDRALDAIRSEPNRLLREKKLQYLRSAETKEAIPSWHQAFGHGPLKDLAAKVSSNPSLLPLYNAMYRFLSMHEHGAWTVLSGVGADGTLAEPLEVDAAEAARAIDAFLTLQLRFLTHVSDTCLPGDEDWVHRIEELHRRRRNALVREA